MAVEARAWITGEYPNQKINFELPSGPKGDKGDTGLKGDKGDTGPSPTDPLVAGYLSDPESESRSALSDAIDEGTVGFLGDGRTVTIADRASGVSTELKDGAGNGAILLHIDHAGAGSPAAYGIDIRNRKGAYAAQVIHQYSSQGPAVWWDNTGSATMLRIKNTVNEYFNPGSVGTGAFFEFYPYQSGGAFQLTDGLTFLNATPKNLTFQNDLATSWGAQFRSSANVDGVQIVKSGTGAGNALRVDNNGTGIGLQINQAGAGMGLKVQQSAAGLYGMQVVSLQNYAAQFVTTTDGGVALDLTKNGLGAGNAMKVVNKGTGRTAGFWDATTEVSAIHANGEYETMTEGSGIIAKAGGVRYRLAPPVGGGAAVWVAI